MPNHKLPEGQCYAGRRPDIAVLSFSVARDVAELVRFYGHGRKMGAFIEKLVIEHHARQEEKSRILQRIRGE